MRRNFYELATPGPAPIASEALKHIAEFYAIEKGIRRRSAEERRLIRQQKSRLLAETFERWLRAKLALIIQKGKLADAIRSHAGKARRDSSKMAVSISTIVLDFIGGVNTTCN
jgi:hypothetical protein